MARQGQRKQTLGKSTKESIPSGLTLRYTLQGHKDFISRIAWSPDGQSLASASFDRTIKLWDAEGGGLRQTLEGHPLNIHSVAWSPNGHLLASGSWDKTIKVWDVETGKLRRTLTGHSGTVFSVAWSPDGSTLASGSSDRTVRLWDLDSGQRRWTLEGHANAVNCIAWSPDGQMLASAGNDNMIRLWDPETGKVVRTLRGHARSVLSVVWAPDGLLLASGSHETTIRLWDAEKGQEVNVLEGHTGAVLSVSFSADGRFLASKSRDNTVRLWRSDTWEVAGRLDEPVSTRWLSALTFHPHAPVLATLEEGTWVRGSGYEGRAIRIWDLDLGMLLGAASPSQTVYYTNAKVVLVGDTGVGKSGLGIVLTGQPFVPTLSTHGRHIWTFDSQEVDIGNGRKETRETLLWDLAGQPGYRLIHQLHLNEVSVMLVVFDARSETDPFAGVRHWERAQRQARRVQGDSPLPLKKFLVAARADRGGISASAARVETLVRDLGFDHYFETSAKEGWNITTLAEAIRESIDWQAMPRVSSTILFQHIKTFLLDEKASRRLLSTTDDLFRAFLRTVDAAVATEDLRTQFEACISLVEARGLIRRLSFGNLVLLQPELLDAYASAMVNAAKAEPDGLGHLAEEDALSGRFRMPQDERLPNKEQERLLLIATVEELLRHELALREPADDGQHLIFPSQFTREWPEAPDPEGKTVVFRFEGPVLNTYSTLAVRLSRSGIFVKQDMWKNATVFSARVGGRCGLWLRELEEGRGELTLFFDSAASEETRFQFEEYVSAHLLRRTLPESLSRWRVFVCPNVACATPVTEMQARRRRERGFNWIDCNVCGERVLLLDREERLASVRSTRVPEMDRAADTRRDLDAGFVSAIAEMRTRGFRKWAGSVKSTVALVFTDIVGSTVLGNTLGNEVFNDILHMHFSHGRQLIEKYAGHEISTIGDAFMVAFRTAAEALNFVLALHADTGDDRVKIRAGIHVGPVHIQEEEAFGTTANYAARVVRMAEGAEIWTSDRAKADIDLEKAEAHRLLRWTEHAERELKGFPGRHRLWSVVTGEA
jgi:WD40 repeat protein/class 3 adenylate cyclase